MYNNKQIALQFTSAHPYGGRGRVGRRENVTGVKPYSPLWKRVIAWERSRPASGYGIIWGDADRNKQEEFSAECHSMDWF